ncbi:hypothetical protein F4825DRAFT_471080 [Nemania diffusa]|nr:hypothetical protein F4825DRAFT_471080 [Nemania diffusa]
MSTYHPSDNNYTRSRPGQFSDPHSEELLFYWAQQSVDDTLTNNDAQSSISCNVRTKLTLRESIGTSGLLSIAGGTLASLVSLGFLIFLWTGQGTALGAVDASSAWRAIILGGWSSQAITLAALVIRTATAIQATTCTSMLAALFLERHYVPKSEVVHFSILRSVNNGPLRLAELASKLKPILRTFSIETALVFSILTSVLALQFASTLLFIDLHNFTIAENVALFPVNDYIAEDTALFTAPPTLYQPPIYAIYGELPSNASSSPDPKGFSTTGLRRRAFLPLREPNMRTAIHSYNGNAIVLSSNIACMPPMTQGITFRKRPCKLDQLGDACESGLAAGTLNYGESLQRAHEVTSLCNSEGCFSANFNCTIPGVVDESAGWSSSLCLVDVVGGDQWHKAAKLDWDSVIEPWSNHSSMYLLFHTNMHKKDWNVSINSHNMTTTTAREWRTYEVQEDRFVNATLCFSNFYAAFSLVDMVATGKLVEPLGNWSITSVGDSSAVRKYLGITKETVSYADRGVLTIKNMSSPATYSPVESGAWSIQPNQTLVEIVLTKYNNALYNTILVGRNTTFQACTRCAFHGILVHPEVASLMQDTIDETSRAVDAVQGFTTTFANTLYSEFLKAFTGAENVRIGYTKMVEVPGGCRENGCIKGLLSVAGLLAFHILCVCSTTITYIKFTRYSRQGNAWHAVSQLTGNELVSLLDRANDIGDNELREEMKKDNNNNPVRLEKRENGKIDLVPKFEASE